SRHDVKFGADINPVRDTVRSETFFSGRFSFGGRVPLALVLNSITGDPNFATTLGQTLAAAGQARLIPNLSAPLTALESFNLGLPEFYQQGFGDPNWIGWTKRYNFFLQDSWRVRPNLTLSLGARYELEANRQPVGTDPNNLAGRFGFAWTPGREGKTVVRGGYGLYYSQINLQVANVADTLAGKQIAQTFVTLTGIPGLNHPRTGRPLTASDVYQTLMAQGVIGRRSIVLEDLAQFGLRPSTTAPLSVVFGIVDDFVNPYAQQASFEIERAVGTLAFSAGYNFNRGAHLVRILDRNLNYAGRRPDGAPIFGFYNPLISQRNIFESTANSFYHAGILQVSKRFSRNVAFNANYTWSKAMDEVTDFNTDFQPNDQLNARAERSLSAFHQAHRLVMHAVLTSPLTPGRGRGAAENLFGGFTLSPVAIASSFRPFNVLTGVDSLGDRHSNTHRPLYAGRNIGKGPNLFTLDLRLARTFKLGGGERPSLEFIAEGFNLLNRTNFKSLNNMVGDVPLSSLPNPLVGRRGIPTE
ncbi:MAG: TonB-dependent receptor, partial [Acidobacteriota bacterium]